MASILKKEFSTIESKNIKGAVVATVSIWRVEVIDHFGAMKVLEFPGDPIGPTDQAILDRLPKPREIVPRERADLGDYIRIRVEKWFGLHQVRLEATLLGETAMAAQVAALENAAWNDVKAALVKFEG